MNLNKPTRRKLKTNYTKKFSYSKKIGEKSIWKIIIYIIW